MSREAIKLALEALEYIHKGANNQGPHTGISWLCVSNKAEPAITALREALAEQPAQQEPVAWPCVIAEADFEQNTITLEMQCLDYKVGAGRHWLSTSPPAQIPWVGLTDDEIYSVLENLQVMHHRPPTTDSRVIFALAIEAKLRSKNENSN